MSKELTDIRVELAAIRAYQQESAVSPGAE